MNTRDKCEVSALGTIPELRKNVRFGTKRMLKQSTNTMSPKREAEKDEMPRGLSIEYQCTAGLAKNKVLSVIVR